MWVGRRWLVVALGGLFLLCVARLGTGLVSHTAGSDPWAATFRFFSGAVSPSLVDQNPGLPAEAEPFLGRLAGDLVRTIRYALIATSLAIPAGLLLGFFRKSSSQSHPRQCHSGTGKDVTQSKNDLVRSLRKSQHSKPNKILKSR